MSEASRPLIVDCFPFFQELDLLEWRLQELHPVVDWFVLVEATHTHSGKPKPLHYGANRQRFARYYNKIRQHVVADLPEGDGLPATRRREMMQRNEILTGVRDLPDDTIILISDLDEIPRRELIPQLPKYIDDGVIGVFHQKLHYYNVNTYAPDRPWPGTRAARLADVRALSPHVIRNALGQPDAHYPRYGLVQNGGWHYSYFGGTERIQNKMSSFLHQELVSEQSSTAATIEARVKAGVDIWGRENEQRFEIGAATDLPWAIRSDPMRWADYFHPDYRPTFHEEWYVGEQNAYLSALAMEWTPPNGAIVEIGCWEGKSTTCLAQTMAPREIIAVDTWAGSLTEGEDHITLEIIRSGRDIEGTFRRNIELLTPGNVRMVKGDWREWAATWDQPIAFLHIACPPAYESVRDQ